MAISTLWLKSLRILHLAPIKVVVYDQPSVPCGTGIPILGGDLALRCFQRLSFPNIATRPLPLAGQPEHQRSVSLGPLVLKRTPLQVSLRPHQIETDNTVTSAYGGGLTFLLISAYRYAVRTVSYPPTADSGVQSLKIL